MPEPELPEINPPLLIDPSELEGQDAFREGAELAKWLAEIEENNRQIRQWYNDQVEPISELNEEWINEGLSAEDRAQRAYEIRHNARLEAREKMIDKDAVARLQQRDMDKYGNPDGPTFEQLVERAQEEGYTGDDIYEYIIGSSRRTDEDVNRRFGIEKGE